MYGARGRAAKITNVAAGQTDEEIESGQSIHVYGFIVSNTSENFDSVRFEDKDGNLLFTFPAQIQSATPCEIEWLADKGLQITTPASITCTIFHSQGGA